LKSSLSPPSTQSPFSRLVSPPLVVCVDGNPTPLWCLVHECTWLIEIFLW
jgi:hypothetical protein